MAKLHFGSNFPLSPQRRSRLRLHSLTGLLFSPPLTRQGGHAFSDRSKFAADRLKSFFPTETWLIGFGADRLTWRRFFLAHSFVFHLKARVGRGYAAPIRRSWGLVTQLRSGAGPLTRLRLAPAAYLRGGGFFVYRQRTPTSQETAVLVSSTSSYPASEPFALTAFSKPSGHPNRF